MAAVTVAVLSNGVVGAEKQAIALARAWGQPYRVLRLLPHRLLAHAPTSLQLLTSRAAGVSRGLFDPVVSTARDLDDVFGGGALPRHVISCGRASILASVSLRALGAGAVRTVHVQHPRCSLSAFDRIVLPRHDLTDLSVTTDLSVARFEVSIGSLHAIDAPALAAARARVDPDLAAAASRAPRVALLLGGATRALPYTDDEALALLAQVYAATQRVGGVLMVTTSRRSPAVLSRAVGELAAADPRVRAWRGAHDEGGSAANPYLEFLATADHVVVTADSVNMVTEAVAAAHFTAAVVHVALDDACDTPPPMPQALLGRGSRRRLESFLKYLFDHQAAVPFEPARPFEREADVPRGGRQLQRDIAEQPARIARAVFGKAEAEAARSL